MMMIIRMSSEKWDFQEYCENHIEAEFVKIEEFTNVFFSPFFPIFLFSLEKGKFLLETEFLKFLGIKPWYHLPPITMWLW